MHRPIRLRRAAARAALFATLLSVSAASFASPRSDAWALRRSNPAEAIRQLEQVTRADPSDAKAFWFLALIYNDQNRGPEGLRALNDARRADPSLAFSSAESIAKIETALQRDAARAGASSTAPYSRPARPSRGTGTVSLADQQQILSALQQNGAYVSPGMASVADATALAQAARAHPNGAKVLVLDALPPGITVGRLARNFHTGLNLQRGLMVVATGRPRQAAAYGGSLVKSQAELDAIVKANAATFTARGYTQGIQGILRQHAAEEASSSRGANTVLLFLVGVPAAGIALLLAQRKKARAAHLERLRTQARDEANTLAPEYEKLDSDFEFALVAEPDADRLRAMREARSQAGEAFSVAMKQLNGAADIAAYSSALAALGQARASLQNARNVLEGKVAAPVGVPTGTLVGAGGYGGALPMPGQDPYDIGPLGAGYAGARPGYGLDFFTSQPVPLNEMVPVEINVNGQRQRVWASRESAQRAAMGQPHVAAVNYGGQMTPWYNAPQHYNPWSNFGSNLVQSIAINSVVNSLFQPHHIHHHHHDYGGGYAGGGYDPNVSGGAAYAGGGYDDNAGAGVANLDLFSSGGSQDAGGYADSSSSLDLFGGGGSSWSSDAS